jgi:hypothetical protein
MRYKKGKSHFTEKHAEGPGIIIPCNGYYMSTVERLNRGRVLGHHQE